MLILWKVDEKCIWMKIEDAHKGAITSLCFGNFGGWRFVVTASQDTTLSVWFPHAAGYQKATMIGGNDSITSVKLTQDAFRMVTGSKDRCVSMFKRDKLNLLKSRVVWRRCEGRRQAFLNGVVFDGADFP